MATITIELAAVAPDATTPVLLSQNCRDGRHGLTGSDECIGCDCRCHATQPTRPARLSDIFG